LAQTKKVQPRAKIANVNVGTENDDVILYGRLHRRPIRTQNHPATAKMKTAAAASQI
jgi:hypothetical protein